MKNNIEITIRGPGTTFFSELNIIKNVFTALGYDVNISDEYDNENNGKIDSTNSTRSAIIIKTIHDPWGG